MKPALILWRRRAGQGFYGSVASVPPLTRPMPPGFLPLGFHRRNLSSLCESIKDLNPHLDYQAVTLPTSERDKSIGDPRGILWNPAGTRGYVSGMRSRNLVIIDAAGGRARMQPLELGKGPTGLTLDEGRHRLYVLNRFAATISVVDTIAETVVTNVPFFDPTPATVKDGRKHHYDTRKTSGLGHVSCASYHVDARFDRLAT